MKRFTFTVLKIFAALILAVVVFVVSFAALFFITPRFEISPAQIRWALRKAGPDSPVDLTFSDLKFVIERPEKNFFAKRIALVGSDVCVRYENEAVISCFSKLNLALTGGWGGERHGKPIIPHLIEIEPIVITGINARIDLPKFPPKPKVQKPASGFDVVNFIRTEVLPRWKIDGSRLELQSFVLKTAPDSTFAARFDLSTLAEERAILVDLHEFRALAGPLHVQAKAKLIRPETYDKAWVVSTTGEVQLDKKKSISLDAKADVASWRSVKFDVSTFFHGIAALRELRLNGALDEPQLNAKVGFKMGASGAQVKALDFVDCGLSANLDKKTGGLRCGPESVRLKLTEKAFLRKPTFFTLTPQFDFRITNLKFDQVKEANFEVDLKLDHMNIFALTSNAKGHVEKKPNENLKYSVTGDLSLLSERFARIVDLMRGTPYSVPAPLNELDGPIELKANLDLSEQGGKIQYHSATRFDSRSQAVHLRLAGSTDLVKTANSLEPSTDATLYIDALRISAPRFDLRVPPKFKPDARFGKLDEPLIVAKDENVEKARAEMAKKKSQPMNVKFRVVTTHPHAVLVTTNLTKAPIPIDMDVLYNQRKSQPLAPPLTGTVMVGRTPVEIFRRNASLDQMRLDFLPTGESRMDADIAVNYLDYDIQINVAGRTDTPQVRLSSDPVLDRNQILSVLIFGRQLNELGDDEKSSVGNLNAAFADAALGLTSLYFLASTPIESVGYNPEKGLVTAQVGIGGGASLEFGSGADGSAVGFKKRLSRDFVFRSDVERLSATGERTVSALIEWVKRF